MVRVYQFAVSPLLPPACRFYPSCSEYTAEAIETHGPVQGAWLGLRRLLRCHPWHPGGVDLVPERHPSGPATGPQRSHPASSELRHI
jgi:hypothetical protein